MVNLLWPWRVQKQSTSNVIAKIELLLHPLEEQVTKNRSSLSNYYRLIDEIRSSYYYCQIEDTENLIRRLLNIQSLLRSNPAFRKSLRSQNLNLAHLIEALGLLKFTELVDAEKKNLLNSFLQIEKSLDEIKLSANNQQLLTLITTFCKSLLVFKDKLFKVRTIRDQIYLFNTLKTLTASLREINHRTLDEESFQQPRRNILIHWNRIISLLSENLEQGYKLVHPRAVVVHSEKDGMKGIDIS